MEARPGRHFAKATLGLASLPAGAEFGRIYQNTHPDPLGYGYAPSRFSDPRSPAHPGTRFGVLYLGTSPIVCFAEAVLRDRRDGFHNTFPLDETDITTRVYATLVNTASLRLVDLRGNGALRLGVPSNVLGARDQSLAQQWSVAFHDHQDRPDGIIYPSRLNRETNLAIYDRAIGKLTTSSVVPLMDLSALPSILDALNVAIMPT